MIKSKEEIDLTSGVPKVTTYSHKLEVLDLTSDTTKKKRLMKTEKSKKKTMESNGTKKPAVLSKAASNVSEDDGSTTASNLTLNISTGRKKPASRQRYFNKVSNLKLFLKQY